MTQLLSTSRRIIEEVSVKRVVLELAVGTGELLPQQWLIPTVIHASVDRTTT